MAMPAVQGMHKTRTAKFHSTTRHCTGAHCRHHMPVAMPVCPPLQKRAHVAGKKLAGQLKPLTHRSRRYVAGYGVRLLRWLGGLQPTLGMQHLHCITRNRMDHSTKSASKLWTLWELVALE